MSYTCPHCGAVSYNENDERERYCGRCHQFADKIICMHTEWNINKNREVECLNCGILYKDAIQIIELNQN